jgi:hypothetical protein
MTHSCTVRAQCARITQRSDRGDFSKSFAVGEKMVDVTGIEPVTPCLRRTRIVSRDSIRYFGFCCFQQFEESAFRSKLAPIR